MIADFFTKPLQGTLFKEFQDFIMNISPSQRSLDRRSVLEPELLNSINSDTDILTPEELCTQSTRNEWTLVTRKQKTTMDKNDLEINKCSKNSL